MPSLVVLIGRRRAVQRAIELSQFLANIRLPDFSLGSTDRMKSFSQAEMRRRLSFLSNEAILQLGPERRLRYRWHMNRPIPRSGPRAAAPGLFRCRHGSLQCIKRHPGGRRLRRIDHADLPARHRTTGRGFPSIAAPGPARSVYSLTCRRYGESDGPATCRPRRMGGHRDSSIHALPQVDL